MPKLLNIAAVLPHGLVVLYEHDGEDVLGLIAGYKQGKYLIFNERERTVELTVSRLTSFQLQGPGDQATTAERARYLGNLRNDINQKAATINLQEVWEITSVEPKEYSDKELAELAFTESSPVATLAMRRVLLTERTFFKRSKVGFLPRSEEDIVQIRRSQEAIAHKRAEREGVIKILKERLGGSLTPIDGPLTYHFEALQDLALHGDSGDASKRKDATELINLAKGELRLDLRGGLHEQAHALLVKSHIWPQRQSLPLMRHGIPTTFKREVFTAIEELPRIPVGEIEYRDYRHLETITIDDPKTLDIDDAISIELLQDGYRIGIHVTDVASFVLPGSVLDAVGSQRATSVYCPDVSVHMFPPELSEGRLSLLPGEERHALSLFITTDRHGSILSWDFAPTVIVSKKRISYDEVDHLLEVSDTPLLAVYPLASSHEGERLANGGVKIAKREALVQVNGDDSLSLQTIDDTSPSRVLVSEMMIIYNRFAAQLCAESGFALPFRGQEPPENEAEPSVPPGPALDYALRVRLKRSSVGTCPTRHFTLGLPHYTQATSPLRRYLDLCTQRQLLAIIATGTPAYTKEAFDELIELTEPALSRANAASREARRFWFLAYLEDRRKTNDLIEATVVRVDDVRGTSVELEEIYQTFPVKGLRSPRLGQRISLRITKVDPFGDYIRLDPV